MRRLSCIAAALCLVFSAHLYGGYADVLVRDVPHVKQKPDFCGEACVQMYSTHLGKTWTQDQVFNAAGLAPALGRGCYTRELDLALGKIGFKTGEVFYRIDPAKVAAQIDEQFAALHADLVKGIGSIVCMHYDAKEGSSEHFRLILGYNAAKDEVIYHEPAAADGAYQRMARADFLKLWPLAAGAKQSMVIRLRLEPLKLADPPAAADSYTPADFAQHVMALKAKLPKGFSVVVQPPFVVVGDQSAEVVEQHATRTVKWAVDMLKQDYFKKNPADILTIWLFKDSASYRKYTKEIFDENPDTPYGYFSARDKALIMNIGTGGGTLVHEIVHPFMATNFPACPSWFNEGMGSLYEQSSEKAGHIRGLPNWRLAGLQKAIGKKSVPPFADLMDMDAQKFYNEDRGTNYAQSRYLCYYLQEKGLLVKYYEQFVANQKDDPSGFKTLKKVLDVDDMDEFKKNWEAFVMKLEFP